MVEYKTVKSEEVSFGKNNFIEIARKKAVTDDGENEFISISRGYKAGDDRIRWKSTIALPCEKEFVERLSSLLLEML
jgi:acetone carboxylase gamma subunit